MNSAGASRCLELKGKELSGKKGPVEHWNRPILLIKLVCAFGGDEIPNGGKAAKNFFVI